MCGKILYLEINDNYVVCIDKKGTLAFFHIFLDNIEPLLIVYGDFIDCNISHNKLYLLTNIEFIVFDMVSNNVEYKEYLVVSLDSKVLDLKNILK